MPKLNYEDYHNKRYMVYDDETPRKAENRLKKEYSEYTMKMDKPLVKKIVINLPYRNSKTWGCVITGGDATIYYVNGKADYVRNLKASGCGYNKSNAIIEKVMNEYALQNLLDYEEDLKDEYARNGTIGGFSNQKLDGVYNLNGVLHYSFGASTGDFFNFSIKRTAESDAFEQYTITFFNGATGKMYAHKVRKPTVTRKSYSHKGTAKTAKSCGVKVNFRKMI